VIDGQQPPQSLAALTAIRTAVERGAPLVAIGAAPRDRGGFWADLLGAVTGPEPAPGEYYASVTSAHSHISAPAPREFAVVDAFAPLVPLGAGQIVVNVRVALRHLPAVVDS